MSNESWYAGESWYAPLKSEKERAAAEEPKKTKKKKKANGWRIAFWCCLGVLLLVGSSLIFRETGSGSGDKAEPPAASDKLPSQKDDATEDWKDFFRSYYEAVENERTQVDIEKGTAPGSFKLTARPALGAELTLQELYQKCAPSVVGISGYTDKQVGYSWGSGVILSSDGLILTNTHVIDGCDRAVVTLSDDSEYEAKLIGADGISDIAVLKIEATGLPAAEFGLSDALTVGERVAAIGNPLGESFRMTLTDGIISAIERGVNYKGRSMTLLQTNTALNEGNSGGPLFNMYGQVVGITNMKMMSSGSSIEGIGFAIPSATVCSVVNALIADGEVRGRPSIGITVGQIPDSQRDGEKIPTEGGLYITAVSEGSDALAKGLREGDVLLEVNGQPVSTTAEVAAIKDAFRVGDSLHFKIWRESEIFEVDVVLVDTNDIYG